MAASLVPTVQRTVNNAWLNMQAELPKLGGEVRPKAAADIFRYQTDEQGVHVTVAPVSFRLKEKAAAESRAIFVTVSGKLSFSPRCTRTDLRTTGFATQVGYFREVGDRRLKHVFGIHYDHDNKLPAHPVYHSQMASMAAFVQDINTAHHRRFDAVSTDDDLVHGLLRNVRIPTAHMDVFSVFLQILGDHLVSEANNAEVAGALSKVRQAMSVFRSDPVAAERLNAVIQQQCFRSYHWYP